MKNPFLNTDKYAIVREYRRINQQKRELSHSSNSSVSQSSSSQKQNLLNPIASKVKRDLIASSRKYRLQYGVFDEKCKQLDLKRKNSLNSINFSKPKQKKQILANQVHKKGLVNENVLGKELEPKGNMIIGRERKGSLNSYILMSQERRRISVYGVQQLRYIPNYFRLMQQQTESGNSQGFALKQKLVKENSIKKQYQIVIQSKGGNNQNNFNKQREIYGQKNISLQSKNQYYASNEKKSDIIFKNSNRGESIEFGQAKQQKKRFSNGQQMKKQPLCSERQRQSVRRCSDQTKGKCDISMFSSNSDNDQILLSSQSENISQKTNQLIFQNIPDPIKNDQYEKYCVAIKHPFTKTSFTHTLHQLQDENPTRLNVKQKSRSICTLQSSRKSQLSYTGTLLNIKNQQYGLHSQGANGAFQRSTNRYQSIFPFPLANTLQPKINLGSSCTKRSGRKSSVFQQQSKNSNSGTSDEFKFSGQIIVEGSIDSVKSQISAKQSVLPTKMSNFYTPTFLNKCPDEGLKVMKEQDSEALSKIKVRGKIYFFNKIYPL